jgi:hypothetical protein
LVVRSYAISLNHFAILVKNIPDFFKKSGI